MRNPGLISALLVACLMAMPLTVSKGANASSTGQPMPRFASLKSDRVNVRGGPTMDHDVVWVFTRAGLPVEITAEFENWRRIRDDDGAEGWVYHSMLSPRRTAMVRSKAKDELVPLCDKAEEICSALAKLQSGVIAAVKNCTGSWCRIEGADFGGFVRQERLWGVYPGEKVN